MIFSSFRQQFCFIYLYWTQPVLDTTLQKKFARSQLTTFKPRD